MQNLLQICPKMAKISPRVGSTGNESLHTVSETDARHSEVQTLVSGLFAGFLFFKYYQECI